MYGREPPVSYAANVTVWPVVYDCADEGDIVGVESAVFTVIVWLSTELTVTAVLAESFTNTFAFRVFPLFPVTWNVNVFEVAMSPVSRSLNTITLVTEL